MNITDLAKEKILVLDGAMGTMIQNYHLNEADFSGHYFKSHSVSLYGNVDVLSLTRPDLIKQIHKQYIEAGADIIETNTFNTTTIAQEKYGLNEEDIYQLNYQSAVLAKTVASSYPKKYVAGCIGPTHTAVSSNTYKHNPGLKPIKFKALEKAYALQIKGLLEGGVDLLIIETVFDVLNAKAALSAIQTYFNESKTTCPIMLSATISQNHGTTACGHSVESLIDEMKEYNLWSIGLNCSYGAQHMRPYIHRLAKKSEKLISVHPSIGLPDKFGKYNQSFENMISVIETYLNDDKLNIIGGCCGTTPKYIKAIAKKAIRYKPRKVEF